MARIVETDNYDGDYPDERFVLFSMSEIDAKRVCEAINFAAGEHYPRYWKVVDNDYELKPGFEP